MTNVHMLKVFTDEDGNYGDAASIIFDEGRRIDNPTRMLITGQLGTVETVFVNDEQAAEVSFVHSQGEIDFAGVAALATAWLLGVRRGSNISEISGRGGRIAVSTEDEVVWVRAQLSTMPPWNHRQFPDLASVEAIKLEDTREWEHTMAWAWVDEAQGLIRARTFATDWDIPEAQGNGSGSMVLASQLGRRIEIKHGEGSRIWARAVAPGTADIGGYVTEEARNVI